MTLLKLALLCLALAFANPAAAQRPGSVEGYYVDGRGERVPLTHITAVWLDGAETGLPPSVRIALTDRAVAPELLERVREPEILHLGDRGEVRGLLLRFEADNPEYVYVDVLAQRAENAWRLADQAVIAAETLRIGDVDRGRAAAAFEAETWITASVRFETPVSYDPVVRRLEGEAARASELMRVSERRFEAEVSGDAAGIAQASTRRSAERYASALRHGAAGMAALIRDRASELREILRNPRVAVFRSRTAALGYDDTVREFALEDGAWKAD